MKWISKGTITIIIFVAVLLTSIGYSAFGNTLSITDIAASVRIDADIRISNIIISEVSAGVISNYEEYNKAKINTNITLPNEDSYIIYDIDVTNYGNTIMGIKSIVNNNSNLKYELLDYIIGEEICNALDKCTLGATKTIKIKVSYNNYDSNNLTQLLNLDFTFGSYYSVIYSSITNNSYPSRVIEGSNLVVNFTENLENLNVSMDGVMLILDTDYTYINNVLTVPNVSGNIKIIKGNGDLLIDHYISENESITLSGITLTSLGGGEYCLNGSSTSSRYFRLTDYLEAATSWTSFNSEGIRDAIIPTTTAFKYKVVHVSGSYSEITGSNQFKITFREPNLTNISTIGYDFYSGYIEPNKSEVDIGMLVIYMSANYKEFDNYVFRIEITSSDEEEVFEQEARDLTDCTSVTSGTGELTISRCSDGLIDLTSNGAIKGSYYIIANENLLKIATSGTSLYDATLAATPKYYSGDTVSIVYEYYRGIPALSQVDSLNFVMRDTSKSMSAATTPKAVNVVGGSTYLEDFVLTGTLPKDSIGVSIYLSKAIVLDHYQFYLTDRKEQ